MKILTVCEQGLNRSVTAKYLLQNEHEVIAAGTANLSPASLEMLCDWADRIILLDRVLLPDLVLVDPSKLLVWDVGPDVYAHHYNPELVRRLRVLQNQQSLPPARATLENRHSLATPLPDP